MEPLIEIELSKWPDLRDLYRTNWPDGAVPFCILDTLITHPDLIETFDIKVFSPEADISNGFVAIINKDFECSVMIHPLKDIKIIERALVNTKLIDWNSKLEVPSASAEVEECLRRLENQLGIKLITENNRALKHFIDRSSKLFEVSSSPPDTYVAELKPEHLHIVDKTWTFYSKTSNKFFEALARNHLTYVLYSTKDDSPLTWVTISFEGSLTHLYCQEEYRKKGYAEFILKTAVNDQLNKGKDVLGYTLEKNVKAQKLFDKLGFDRIGVDTWIYVTN